MKEPNRFHDNLIYGYGCLDSSRPLDFFNPIRSPRVYGRPINIRQIVSWWGRLKAAWIVFKLDAVAVKWYDEKNAHRHGKCWHEWARLKNAEIEMQERQEGVLIGAGASVITNKS